VMSWWDTLIGLCILPVSRFSDSHSISSSLRHTGRPARFVARKPTSLLHYQFVHIAPASLLTPPQTGQAVTACASWRHRTRFHNAENAVCRNGLCVWWISWRIDFCCL
jgi:hypothetical protein